MLKKKYTANCSFITIVPMISPTNRIIHELEVQFGGLSVEDKNICQGLTRAHDRDSLFNMLLRLPHAERIPIADALYSILPEVPTLIARMRTVGILTFVKEEELAIAFYLQDLLRHCEEVEKEDILEEILFVLNHCAEISQKGALVKEIVGILLKLPSYTWINLLKTIRELSPKECPTILNLAAPEILSEKFFFAPFIILRIASKQKIDLL